jgi:hypothetical protein
MSESWARPPDLLEGLVLVGLQELRVPPRAGALEEERLAPLRAVGSTAKAFPTGEPLVHSKVENVGSQFFSLQRQP